MTNAVLNLVVLAVLAVVLAPRLHRLRPGPIAWTGLVMLALTVVFDTVMIAAGLYDYDLDKILAVYLWGAPVEDLAYPLAAVMLMPALWTALGARWRRTDPEHPTPGGSP